jgi:hypothetical protein
MRSFYSALPDHFVIKKLARCTLLAATCFSIVAPNAARPDSAKPEAATKEAAAGDEIFPQGKVFNNVQGGLQFSYGSCPCFRWTIKTELAGGEFETQDFLISSEALFQYIQNENAQAHAYTAKLFKVGALEALLKGAHLGVGFDGVTFGEDRDQGYQNIVRTGFYVLVNLLRSDAARLDLRTGYEYDSLSVNAAPNVSRNIASETATFKWDTGHFAGKIEGRVFIDADRAVGYSGAAGMMGKAKIKDFVLGAGIQASYSHDLFRLPYGLDPNIVIAGVYLDVGYEPVFGRKKGK